MVDKIKRLCYLLSGIIAGLLMTFLSASPASAYNFDIHSAGSYKFLAGSSRFYNRDGGNAAMSYLSTDSSHNYYPNGIGSTTGGQLSYVVLALDTNIPAGSLLSFIWAAPESYVNIWSSPIQPHPGFGQFVVLDYESITGSNSYVSSSDVNSGGYVFTKVTILTTEPLNAFAFNMSWIPLSGPRWFGFFPQTYVQLKSDDSQAVIDAIKNSSDQAHTDSQAQLDFDKEQAKKEEEQRKEDEDKANQAGSDSQTSSDNSQSEVDSASKGLFDILTSFVGSITGASPGTCSVSGNFGFFDAGNIDLCTGSSKITPITNVVGAVMLIGLIIPACVVLLHRFVDLYNEVMN